MVRAAMTATKKAAPNPRNALLHGGLLHTGRKPKSGVVEVTLEAATAGAERHRGSDPHPQGCPQGRPVSVPEDPDKKLADSCGSQTSYPWEV